MQSHVRSVVEDQQLVARRRTQLVEAAIALFSRVGYHAATVKQIADAAGVSAGLVYQYVPDKQDLLFLALLHIVEQNKQEIPAATARIDDPLVRLEAAIDAYTRVIDANRQAVLLTYRETKSLKPRYVELIKRMELETNALIEICVKDCIAAGYLAPTHAELLVYRIITGAHAWALKHWRLRSIATLDIYMEQNIHSCWTALLTAAGRRKYERIKAARPARKRKAPVKPARKSMRGRRPA
jgi:AcrR family transcriptional regulator